MEFLGLIQLKPKQALKVWALLWPGVLGSTLVLGLEPGSSVSKAGTLFLYLFTPLDLATDLGVSLDGVMVEPCPSQPRVEWEQLCSEAAP